MFSDWRSTIRYDQVAMIPKVAAQDTTLTVGNAGGGRTTIPVPSGTEINIHVPGIHYNRAMSSCLSWRQVLTKSR